VNARAALGLALAQVRHAQRIARGPLRIAPPPGPLEEREQGEQRVVIVLGGEQQLRDPAAQPRDQVADAVVDGVIGVVHPDVDRVEEHAVESVALGQPFDLRGEIFAPGWVPGIQPGLPAGVVRARKVPVRLVSVEAVARRALEKRRRIELAEARQPRIHAVAAEHRHQVHAERARPVAERCEARLPPQLRLRSIVTVLPVVAALPPREIGEHASSLDALR